MRLIDALTFCRNAGLEQVQDARAIAPTPIDAALRSAHLDQEIWHVILRGPRVVLEQVCETPAKRLEVTRCN